MEGRKIVRNLMVFGFFAVLVAAKRHYLNFPATPFSFTLESAEKYCENFGSIAIFNNESRRFIDDHIESTNSLKNHGIYTKYCVIQDKNQLKINNFAMINSILNSKLNPEEGKSIMTDRIFEGDQLHVTIKMDKKPAQTMFQLTDRLVESVQKGVLQTVFARILVTLTGISVGSGGVTVSQSHDEFRVDQSLYDANKFPKNFSSHKNIDLTVRFSKKNMLIVKIRSGKTRKTLKIKSSAENPNGTRMYFTKFFENRILDVYFTRGNCSKSTFQKLRRTGDFLNCHYTRQTPIIPVYSCRLPSFVLCEYAEKKNLTTITTKTTNTTIVTTSPTPFIINSTTEIPPKISTGTTRKSINSTEKNVKNSRKPEKLTAISNGFFADFLEDYRLILFVLWSLSVILLGGSIVLQILKMRQK